MFESKKPGDKDLKNEINKECKRVCKKLAQTGDSQPFLLRLLENVNDWRQQVSKSLGSLIHLIQILATRCIYLQTQYDALLEASKIDTLTLLGNRDAFEEDLDRLESKCARHKIPGGLVLLDLAGVGQKNNEKGWKIVDEIFKKAAQSIEDTIREHDQAYRLHDERGDEFAILLEYCSEEGLKELVDRLEKAFADDHINAYFGWAARPIAEDGDDRSMMQLAFESANEKLNENKNRIKNSK